MKTARWDMLSGSFRLWSRLCDETLENFAEERPSVRPRVLLFKGIGLGTIAAGSMGFESLYLWHPFHMVPQRLQLLHLY